MSAQIKVNQLRTLFKYVSDRVWDDIFVKHKIRFTQPAALNDPREFSPAIRFDSDGDNFKSYEYDGIKIWSKYDWYWLNIIEAKINRFGILSLTDNPYSFEMWCHYANGHSGFLLEFDIPDKTKPSLQLDAGINLRAHKVKYVKDYTINIDRLARDRNSIPFHKIRDTIFLKKTKHWKYEREYRIVRQLDECETYRPPAKRTSYRDRKVYNFPLSLNCISSVSFGINTSRKIKKKIIELCGNTKIAFLQTVLYKDLQNKIAFIPIDSFGSVDKYLDLMPQVFLFDSIKLKYKESIFVKSLQEIPYYSLQPNDVDKYYRKQQAKAKIAKTTAQGK